MEALNSANVYGVFTLAQCLPSTHNKDSIDVLTGIITLLKINYVNSFYP